MEDRIIHHICVNTDENIKSPHSLSVCSDTHTHNSNNSSNSNVTNDSCSCINHHDHHDNFKSSTSCTHTYTSTNNTNTTSHFSTMSNITLKSNSPAILIPNNRRNSLSINSGDIIDNNLTVLHLTNSETIDTKDVYVMANENNNSNTQTIPKPIQKPFHNHNHNTLSIPKWCTDIEESADEYDSEAHTITDEDIIIKRVLAKFNQQNQQIIRRKISFVDSFQFFQSNIDHQKQSISYRYNHKNNKNTIKKIKKTKNKKSKKNNKSKKKKKKNIRDHSESDPMRYNKYNRKLSDGHQQILSDISRRATINEIPKSLSEYSKKPKSMIKKCKKHRNTHSHVRTITPFDPITENIFDTSDSDSDIGDLRDIMHNKKNTKHKKTLTAININLSHSPSDSHTMSMNTPEPDIIHINHRKTMSHGPRLMSNISNNNNHTRRHASIVPNMEEIDDEILSNVFIDMDIIDNDSENENDANTPMCIKPKLTKSCSSPPMIKTTVDTSSIGNNDVIKPTEWKELETLNEASDEENDDDMDDLDFHIKEDINIKEDNRDEKCNIIPNMKHRRLISAPIKLKSEQRSDLHIYRTWNYFEEMSDSLKSDYNSDNASDHDTDHSDNDNHNDDRKINDDIAFGTERVFSTFTRELAITSENPKYLFEALSSICVSLRSKDKSFNVIKHRIPFDSPILKYERVISFLKLLGFNKNTKLNAYIINKIDTSYVDAALSSCQQQLIELSKKSTTYEIISNSRLRNNSVNTSLNIPSPTILHEKKSDKPESDDLDLDRCQLYELIWSATHPNNNDHKAKYVILLCYILITTPIKFIKLLEARFFNDDHGRSSRSYSSISFDNSYAPPGYISANGSPTVGSSNLLLGSSMGQSPTIPSSLPSLTTSSITFDYEKIHSSYGVQKKVVHMIRLWMQKYWTQDWNNNYKLLSYIDIFVRKANKAYKNDDNFDDCERNKGLELIATIHKTIQKQKAEIKFNKSAISLVENNNNNNNNNGLKINNIQICRPRSVSSNTEVINRDKIGGIMNSRKRRKSVTKHKRKFSLLSTPKLSKMGSYDGSNSNDSERDIPSDLLKISNELICNQLALYLFNKYSLISGRECLYQYSPIHKHKENICPNIQIYKDAFNNIVKWVQSTILLQQQVSKRARIIKKWIKITDLLFNIRCFQGFVAVQCALSSQAIYTLKDAWNCNNVLKRKHHTKYKEIKVIMSASHNFENLRRLQREAHAPLIPYFGIFCKDLIYIQEGVSKRNSDGMINWNKLWRISELIKEHLNYKNTPYEKIIKININMQNWLQIQLKQYGTLKTEHIDKIAKDVAQKDKKNKKIRHKKSFTLMQ